MTAPAHEPPVERVLIRTKLAPPRPPRGVVARPSVTGRMSEPARLLLVCAPAGYGKTTAIVAWLAGSQRRHAFVDLDAGDNDPAVFVAYVVAAVTGALPGLELEPSIDRDRTMALLLNGIAGSGAQLAITLDDYHAITNPAVHVLVERLIQRLPSNAALVVATRHDPPLPLARLRSRGELIEIRAADLAFSAADADTFFADTMGIPLESGAVARLTEQTEGWIAGLQLAGLSLRRTEDRDAFVSRFGASDRYVMEYLTEQALASEPDDVRGFLEVTSVLDRLAAPLCNALTGRADAREMLARVAEANLFVAPLDGEPGWYRYHPLFAELLAAGLDPDRRRALDVAAASWFAANGLPTEAIRHLHAAGAAEEASRLVERESDAALARGEFDTILAWVRDLPPSLVDQRPTLGLFVAWAQFLRGDLGHAETALQSVSPAGLKDPQSRGRLACLQAWFANRHDEPSAPNLAEAALASLPEADAVFRSLAWTTLGESVVGTDAERAREAFVEASRLAMPSGHSVLYLGTLYSLANVDLTLGHREAAEQVCRDGIAAASRGGAAQPSIGMLHLKLGCALYEADELPLARQHFAIGHELTDAAQLHATLLGAAEWQEALTLHALGDTVAAWRLIRAVRAEGERLRITRVALGMRLAGVELALLEGRVGSAREELDALEDAFVSTLGVVPDRGRETTGRVLLAERRADEAATAFRSLAIDQRASRRVLGLVSALVNLAAAETARADPNAAYAALREAVHLASPEQIRRPFLDRVFPARALLEAHRSSDPGFIGDVLARTRLSAPASNRSVGDDDYIEPLSARELEVLRLVAAGLSNDEIGRQLYVSTGTAKWHVHNVLGKLGARNRAAVIARARSIGLV